MNKYVINGKFVNDTIQGISRYAFELTKELDNYIDDSYDITLCIPKNARNVPKLKNIKIIEIGKFSGIVWEQMELRNYLSKTKSICINFCNTTPLFIKPGITVMHDIMCKVNPNDYRTIRNRISRIWHCFQYSYITFHEDIIITVSEFSKSEIIKHYPKSAEKIVIVPSAWQHVLRIEDNNSWNTKYNWLKNKAYYFSLSTLSRNKNGKWIIEVAKRNASCLFVVAGKKYENEYRIIPKNVCLLGYIPDEDIRVLIKHCKAFIFPSLYEGFGLPPLEALGLGANVISSDSSSLKEVLKDDVVYINPNNYNIDIERIDFSRITEKKSLKVYSWKRSAKEMLQILENYEK